MRGDEDSRMPQYYVRGRHHQSVGRACLTTSATREKDRVAMAAVAVASLLLRDDGSSSMLGDMYYDYYIQKNT